MNPLPFPCLRFHEENPLSPKPLRNRLPPFCPKSSGPSSHLIPRLEQEISVNRRRFSVFLPFSTTASDKGQPIPKFIRLLENSPTPCGLFQGCRFAPRVGQSTRGRLKFPQPQSPERIGLEFGYLAGRTKTGTRLLGAPSKGASHIPSRMGGRL